MGGGDDGKETLGSGLKIASSFSNAIYLLPKFKFGEVVTALLGCCCGHVIFIFNVSIFQFLGSLAIPFSLLASRAGQGRNISNDPSQLPIRKLNGKAGIVASTPFLTMINHSPKGAFFKRKLDFLVFV